MFIPITLNTLIYVLSRLNLHLKMKPVILDNWWEGRIGKLDHLKMAMLRKSESCFCFLFCCCLYHIPDFSITLSLTFDFTRNLYQLPLHKVVSYRKCVVKTELFLPSLWLKNKSEKIPCIAVTEQWKYQKILEDLYLTLTLLNLFLQAVACDYVPQRCSSKPLLTCIQRSGHLHFAPDCLPVNLQAS